jgi:nicotinamidase-related amidase
MPRQAEARHVSSRRSTLAVLVVDLLQPFAGEEGELLWGQTRKILPALRKLLKVARARGVPVIYVNDHFEGWDSDRRSTIAATRAEVLRGLRPRRQDLFVLKPARSAFYQCPLESLLEALGVKRLVLTGVATDVCVLATASDALVRKFACVVPADGCATLSTARQTRALRLMDEALGIDVRESETIRWPTASSSRASGRSPTARRRGAR